MGYGYCRTGRNLMDILPPHLQNERHKDWIWPFCYIPRRWTAFSWGTPELLYSNSNLYDVPPKPITRPGTWQISYYSGVPWYWKWAAWYFAWSGLNLSGKFP